MFGSGDRHPDQVPGFWFPPWRQQSMRPNPQPTQTTQTTSQQPTAAGSRSAPATRALGPTASRTQPAAGPTRTASQAPSAPAARPVATSQAPRGPAPSQTQRQSPTKPVTQPQQTKVPEKSPPPSQPSSTTKPQTPAQTQTSTDKKSKPQTSPAKTQTNSPAQPQPQPTPTTIPSTSQTEKSKAQIGQLPPTKTPYASETESKKPTTAPEKPVTQEIAPKPIPDAETAPTSSKGPHPQPTLQTVVPISSKSAPQAQEALKDSKTKPQLTSQIQEVSPSHPPQPQPEPKAAKIIEVEPAKAASQSEKKHIDEPQTIPIPEVPKSSTTFEIVSRTSQTDLSPKQLKSEDGEKAETAHKHGQTKNDHGSKPDSVTLMPLQGTETQGTETKKEADQEKQKQTTTHDRKTDPPKATHDALGAANSGAKETKTVVQVKQKDKHLESEVFQQEKLQHVDQGLHKDAMEGITRHLNKKSDGPQTKSGEDEPVRVITLAGENRGAQMDISNGSKRKDGALHIHRGYKLGSEDKAGQSGDDEESHKISHDSERPFIAYINNNTQSVNNSILYHSACNSNNPGVHLNVTNNTTERMWHRDGHGAIHRPGITAQAHKLKAESTVRRRCLRSLFMESSDSDPENTGKPRRHGCRYVCPVESIDPLRATKEDLNANSSK